jgi:hypothetical protein
VTHFPGAVVSIATGVTLGGALVLGQAAGVDEAALARLLSMPRATHHSQVRADYDAVRDRTRIWIDTNEDDTRLWSIPGQQMDMELRVSAVVPGRGGTWPREIDVEFATLGTLEPGAEPHALSVLADGRAVVLRQTPEPVARSGSLVFMTIRATIDPVELVRLASASRVEGRVWGHRFALVSSQFEILRAFVARLAER